jgi:acyl carrier protein phosphodiesterase
MSNLTATLQETLLQLKKVMADRRSRIEALRAEIAEIEAENETLQAAIESMLNDF